MRSDAAQRARGHAPGMPTADLLRGNNLIFQKTLIFRKSLQICGQAAAKAGACSSYGQGSPQGQATKAKAYLLTCMHAAKAKAMVAPMGWHAAKAKACSQGHDMLAWARWHAPGCRQEGPSMHAA